MIKAEDINAVMNLRPEALTGFRAYRFIGPDYTLPPQPRQF